MDEPWIAEHTLKHMTPQLKETDYVKTWALFTLCATAGGFIAGAVAGGILGAALGAAGVPIHIIKVLCSGAGFLIALPISYLFFRLFVSRFIVEKLTAQTASTAV